jgi:DNA-binding NarL/FixJ family response regulator
MTNTTPHIRVLLIQEDHLLREGLRALLEREPEITVVAAIDSFRDAVSITAREKPDLLLIDVDRNGTEDGLEMLGALLQEISRTPILVLAGQSNNIDEVSGRVAKLGASGLVLKQQSPELLNKAIRKVLEGEVWFDRASLSRIVREKIEPAVAEEKTSLLTVREREVIGLVAEGLKNKQIGERLFITQSTVTHHLGSIFSKLQVSDRTELLIYAFSQNLAKVPRVAPR